MELTLDEIKKLMQDFKDIGLGEMAITQGEFSIKLASENFSGKSFEVQNENINKPKQASQTTPQESKPSENVEEKPQPVKGTFLNAPVVGTIYTAPSPTDEPFIKVGDKVKKGQVVFIIESMKLLNEVTCDIEGEVAEIMAENGEAVEYGQPILRIV